MKRLFLFGIILLLPILCFARSGVKSKNVVQVIEVEKVKWIPKYKEVIVEKVIEKNLFEELGVKISADTSTRTILIENLSETIPSKVEVIDKTKIEPVTVK